MWHSFKRAKKFAISLKLKGKEDWENFSKSGKRPVYIPSCPHHVYTEWTSWYDWLGIPNGSKMSLKELINTYRKERKKIGYIKADRDYGNFSWIFSWAKKNYGIGTHDFKRKAGFNDTTISTYKTYIPLKSLINKYKRGRKKIGYANANKDHTNFTQIFSYAKARYSLTSHEFKKKAGFDDSKNFGKKWWPFKKAKKFARSLHLKSAKEWRIYCQEEPFGKAKKPLAVPTNPQIAYKNKGWNGFKDWLKDKSIQQLLKEIGLSRIIYSKF